MSDDRPCVTNHESMGAVPFRDRPFPCRRRGLHYASCPDPEQCRGCVPRSALHDSFLCPACSKRVNDTVDQLGWLIAHLRSIEKPAQALGERVATSMERSILMPDTWIAADELLTAIDAPVIPSTASMDDAIRHAHDAVAAWTANLPERLNTLEGATQAVVLMKRVSVALKRWPDSEAELRPIPHMKCPSCGWDHLWRQGPAKKGDDERVICGTPGCGYSFPFLLWTAVNAPEFARLEKDNNLRRKAAKKVKAA